MSQLGVTGNAKSMTETQSFRLGSFPAGGVGVVFGATGGLGSALSTAIARSGRFTRLCALSRAIDPTFDLLDEESIERAARHAAAMGDIRLIIDATGFLHDASQKPEKTWRDISPETMIRALSLNTIGPALIMKHVLPLLPSSGKAVFATLSARVGSIDDNRLGGWYSYRASKAALNQIVRTAAIELKRSRTDAICVSLHPGTVDTPLSQPFARRGLQIQTPSASAAHLISVIDRLKPEDTGGFFDWRGARVPW
ncbi:MAG: SDR family NAD(P)-dependent oxidoreductase [Methyloceanibacter sp.]|nr:SDR family NAD(P)-dependent oxidoreductase [Methyloceanibacter sp.]